jgi:hypothetical protein
VYITSNLMAKERKGKGVSGMGESPLSMYSGQGFDYLCRGRSHDRPQMGSGTEVPVKSRGTIGSAQL